MSEEEIAPMADASLESSSGRKVQKKPMPALTIVIQSWATPIVGLLMLFAGAALGFWARPLINPASTPTAVAGAPLVVAATPTPAGEEQDLMELVVSQTRHFLGDADAPVTLIEFSDFQ